MGHQRRDAQAKEMERHGSARRKGLKDFDTANIIGCACVDYADNERLERSPMISNIDRPELNGEGGAGVNTRDMRWQFVKNGHFAQLFIRSLPFRGVGLRDPAQGEFFGLGTVGQRAVAWSSYVTLKPRRT